LLGGGRRLQYAPRTGYEFQRVIFVVAEVRRAGGYPGNADDDVRMARFQEFDERLGVHLTQFVHRQERMNAFVPSWIKGAAPKVENPNATLQHFSGVERAP
jgi:hypothetical protein